MCGIFAASTRPNVKIQVADALESIRHRGPDDSGVFISTERDAHLGHVRLSILDLSSAGRQPMMDRTERYYISYNGEVYNYIELKQELNEKHGPIQWKTETDTEVIIEGFALEGVHFLNRLNGIFSVAIYDILHQILLILRDPIGIKPLLKAETQYGVFFCSEIKALTKMPGVNTAIRSQSLADQLAFVYIPEPKTLHQGIVKVPPGQCLQYKHGRLIKQTTLFKHLNTTVAVGSFDETADQLRNCFRSAVHRQLRSHAPVSLFLSGGLDSSAVAYFAKEAGSQIQDAYTISFSEEDRRHDRQSDDLFYAKKVSKQLGINLETISASNDFLDELPELVHFMEDGIADPAAINTYLICKEASKSGVKVMLSGQGADEYLGGYRRYLAERTLRKLPRPLLHVTRLLGSLLPTSIPGRLNAANRRIKRLSDLASSPPNARVLAMYTWTQKNEIESLFVDPLNWDGGDQFEELLDSYSQKDIAEAMMLVDQHYDLLSLNLTYTDKMSMAVGVEARVPFLDFELVRLMNSIPIEMKIRAKQGKSVFKRAMENHLPHEIIYREKAGFGLPIRAWLARSNNLVDHYLNPKRIQTQGLYFPEKVSQIVEEQKSGRVDRANTIFTLLCQQLWLEQNL